MVGKIGWQDQEAAGHIAIFGWEGEELEPSLLSSPFHLAKDHSPGNSFLYI